MSALSDGHYFTVAEMKCADGTPYPEEFAGRLARLFGLLDAIREKWGGPLIVESGYRSPAHNQALVDADNKRGAHGVASGSYHVTGEAADLRTRHGRDDVPQLYRVIIQLHEAGMIPELGGIAMYPVSGWCHVDIHRADDGHLRRWTGS